MRKVSFTDSILVLLWALTMAACIWSIEAKAQQFDYPDGQVLPADLWGPFLPPAVQAPADPPGHLTCPFQTDLPQTAQLSQAHTGQFTRYRDSGAIVDVWFYAGNALTVTLRTPTGWLHGEAFPVPGADTRVIPLRLYDATGARRGDLVLCADPTGWRTPKGFGESKEIIGSGCSVLSVAYQIDGVVSPAELYMRTVNAPVTPACFR